MRFVTQHLQVGLEHLLVSRVDLPFDSNIQVIKGKGDPQPPTESVNWLQVSAESSP